MRLARFGFTLARPVLHAMDGEAAHLATLAALKLLPPISAPSSPPVLQQRIFGLDFANPLGLAAGFDKNAEVPLHMLGLGFGFVEAGTVTPRAQTGNPRPRLFRLVEDEAVINRMGFNNQGHDAAYSRMVALKGQKRRGPIGINIGANKDAVDRIADYVEGVKRFGAVADYLTINISSPNTPGLRGLQSRGELEQLLSRIAAARTAARLTTPVFLKIAPDLGDDELQDIATTVPGLVDGVIVSNTTLSRPKLSARYAQESGGLSGAPLFTLSTRVLARFHVLTAGKIPLIGAGGIHDSDTAWIKLGAGASLLQLYSALVFRGPGLVTDIVDGLAHKCRDAGFSSVSQRVGQEAERLSHHRVEGT
jgi:dihydroorotate dehydrogenase